MNTKKNEIKKRYYEIISGPSKDALFDACKYAYSKATKFAINFGVAGGYTMPRNHPECAYVPMEMHDVLIFGIEHEDGSGDSFNIHGLCKAVLYGVSTEVKSYKFKAYYNTKTRSGIIVFSNT